jgi:hypothetical protein
MREIRVTTILFWFFIILALILLILRAHGSPAEETIIAALIGAIGALWKEYVSFLREFSNFKEEVREFMSKVERKLKIK